jgi:DNA-binding CsgD family transcriptional regulator
MDQQELIDNIYECAFAPDWPKLLGQLSPLVGGLGGFLFSFNPQVGVLRWLASDRVRPDFAAYTSEGWIMRDARSLRMQSGPSGGFLTEDDIFTGDELENDPTYQAFYRPRGLGRTLITAVFPPMGDRLIVGIEREYSAGPAGPPLVQRLNDLRPHLARSMLMSARMQLERARVATETLALIGLPALVLDENGRVMAANDLIEALNGRIRWLARDRVSLADGRADTLLRQAVTTLGNDNAPTTRSFPVRGDDAQAAMVAHLIPVRGAARDILSHCAGVLVLTPVSLPAAPPVELIQSLFDLTPAEARVARNLAAGETLEEIAVATGLSRNTIRSQLRGALDKTGSRRQAELVALLGGIASWRK